MLTFVSMTAGVGMFIPDADLRQHDCWGGMFIPDADLRQRDCCD